MDKKIAVLLPHYNNYKGLELTLDSLLSESELLTLFLIDDGSDEVDEVENIVNAFNCNLDIIFVKNKVNLGITKTLNRGLKKILDSDKFDLIARIDAGDIAINKRFYQQKQMFLKDKDLGLVASWVRFVNEERQKLFDFKPPTNYNKLKKVIYLYNPFVHSASMFRVEAIKKIGLYPEEYFALEDHAYFFEFSKVFKTGNKGDYLMECELTSRGVSVLNRKSQTKSRVKLLLSEYRFGFYPLLGLFRAYLTHIIPLDLLVFTKRYFFR